MCRVVKRLHLSCAILAAAAALSACEAPAASTGAGVLAPVAQSQTSAAGEGVEATPRQTNVEESPRLIDDAFVKGDSLSYGGYVLEKRWKRVRYVYPREMKSPPEWLDATYAVLRRGRRVVAVFDGVYSALENATHFGLFSFLGGDSKQLAVSLTIPRGGRHWVVDLSSGARVVFDSGDYEVGREELSVIDVDRDGRYEISMPVTAFYMFEEMSMAETPLPEIVFKYDKQAGKYLPANADFPAYALRGVEDGMRGLDSAEGHGYLSKRLDILLRYVYAGRRQEGWNFFNREYRRADRDVLASKIRAELKRQRLYQFIYRKGGR